MPLVAMCTGPSTMDLSIPDSTVEPGRGFILPDRTSSSVSLVKGAKRSTGAWDWSCGVIASTL